jgi:hypothetical protein
MSLSWLMDGDTRGRVAENGIFTARAYLGLQSGVENL